MLKRLQYIFNNKTAAIKSVSFKNTNSIENIEKIVYFKEEGVTGNWQSKQFRYSWDNDTWSPWATLTQQALININFNNRENFFLEIKYTRDYAAAANIQSWFLFYDSWVESNDDDEDEIIDADLLQGEPGTFYLDRANHYGISDLGFYLTNVPDPGSGTEVYAGYYDISMGWPTDGRYYTFKKLLGSSTIALTDASNGPIQFDIDSSWLDLNVISLISANEASIAVLRTYDSIQDASINLIEADILNLDTSIFDLWVYTDGSLVSLDASLNWLYDNYQPPGTYVTEASLGSTFIWNNGYLDVSGGGGSGTYDTNLDDALEMPSDVGGIPAGTTVADLKGDTLISLWDDLLFPTVNPTYSNPGSTFSDNISTLQIIGDSLNITYTTNFSRGGIYVSGNFQDYRSGLPSGYYYTDPSSNSLLVDVSSSSLSNVQVVSGYVVTIGNQSWTSYVDYLEGPQPYDNKGNPYGSPLSAGSTSTDTITVEGVYPLFGTTSDITVSTQQSLVSMLSGNNIVFNMVAESLPNRQQFDIPDVWEGAPTNRSLQGIETYNTVSGSWEYQGESAAASLTYWDTSSTTHTIEGSVINYIRYAYNSDVRGAVQIRLKF